MTEYKISEWKKIQQKRRYVDFRSF